MATVGPLIVEPDAGSYCWITLDSGEQILVNHDTGGFKRGYITIEAPKAFGLSTDPILECDLDSPDGRAALGKLASDTRCRSGDSPLLNLFVEYVKDCGSVAAAKSKCDALLVIR